MGQAPGIEMRGADCREEGVIRCLAQAAHVAQGVARPLQRGAAFFYAQTHNAFVLLFAVSILSEGSGST